MTEQQALMYTILGLLAVVQLLMFHIFFTSYGTPQQDSLCDKRWKIVYFILPVTFVGTVIMVGWIVLEKVFMGIKSSFQGIKRYFGLS